MQYQVLVIDDDAMDRKTLRRQLQQDQRLVIRVASGAHEALRMLAELPVHLVVCDLKMPRVNGFDLCNLIHAMFGDLTPKTMLISGNPFLPMGYAEHASLFDDFCIKTPDGNTLLATARKLLALME